MCFGGDWTPEFSCSSFSDNMTGCRFLQWKHLDVSENSGTPKSSIKKWGFPFFSPSILGGTPIFGNTYVDSSNKKQFNHPTWITNQRPLVFATPSDRHGSPMICHGFVHLLTVSETLFLMIGGVCFFRKSCVWRWSEYSCHIIER